MDITRRLVMVSAAAPFVAAAASAAELGLDPNSKADQSRAMQKALDRAAAAGEDVVLPPGKYKVSGLKVSKPLRILGVPGRSILVAGDGGPLLSVTGAKSLGLHGLVFQGKSGPVDAPSLLTVEDCGDLDIGHCAALGGGGSGMVLKRCAGRVSACEFGFLGNTGLLALDSTGLEIAGNHVHDIGNNGIQVWRSEVGEDGTLVSANRVQRIGAVSGGSGQNGNGINVYRAGNVLIAGNRVTDCAYSAIRDNSGSHCQITGNTISRTDEVAIYVEFAFEGALVSNNLIEDVCFGISITNLDQGGRLAVCANNLIRRAKGGTTEGVKTAGGIYVEADAAVTGNVIEDARDVGIGLGWGRYCRNLMATGNLVKGSKRGITISAAEGAETVLVASNTILASGEAAVIAMDHLTPVSGDLTAPGAAIPAHITLQGNLVR